MKQFYFIFLLLVSFFGFSQEAYYTNAPNSVDFNLSGIQLKTALETKIRNNTTPLPYSSSTSFDTWDALKLTDVNPVNSVQVLLIYGWENGTDGDVTNDRERDIDNNGGNVGQWNREHVFPKSLATPALDTNIPGASTDIHNLRASDVQRNSDRGNLLFASGTGNSGVVGSYWYPGDEWKGDVARMIMYMYLMYNGDGSSASGTQCLPINVGVGNPVGNDNNMIDLFLQWNVDDSVSDIERQRNPVSETNQGNRNPFIDNPYLATKIWGGPAAEDTWGTLDSDEFATIDFKMYPNPTKNDFVYVSTTLNLNVIVYDILGKQVKVETINNNKDYIDISSLHKGLYIVKFTSDTGSVSKKLIVQ